MDHSSAAAAGNSSSCIDAVAGVGLHAQPMIDTQYHAVSQDSRGAVHCVHYTEIDFARSLHRLTKEEVSSKTIP